MSHTFNSLIISSYCCGIICYVATHIAHYNYGYITTGTRLGLNEIIGNSNTSTEPLFLLMVVALDVVIIAHVVPTN